MVHDEGLQRGHCGGTARAHADLGFGQVGLGGEASAASASADQPLASEFVLELPVMVNTKAVSNEEELLLHRPKVVDHDKKAKAVNLAKLITAKVNEKASSQ